MQAAKETKITTLNQALEVVEKVFKGWIGPVVADPSRKQLLENVAGIVARVLSDIDLGTMIPLYPKINEWIQDQSRSYWWREIKQPGGQSYKPRRFAPNDETAIMAIAAACLIPHELPMPLPPDQEAEMEKRISAFLSGIERAAENGTYTDEDWYRFIDNAISNPTEAAVSDLMSTVIMYGGEFRKEFDGWFAKLGPNPATTKKLDDWVKDEQDALKKPVWSPLAFLFGLIRRK